MSNARKITRLLGLMVLMAFAFTALTGSASAANKKQKALLKQVKKNPGIVKNKKFIKKAAALDFKLPVTVRFSRCLAANPNNTDATSEANDCLYWQTANDVVNIDLGNTLGNGAITPSTLSGALQLWAEFADPRDGDAAGDLRLSAAATTPNLSLTGINVLSNADILTGVIGAPGNTGVGTNGCQDFGSAAVPYGATSIQAMSKPALLTDWGAKDSQPTPSTSIVFRTAPIDVAVNAARGTANLFNGNVDLTVEATVKVNSVFRELDNESPMHCVEVQTGTSTSSGVTVQARETAGLEIDPAVTKDGKLRLANVILTNGPVTRPEITACLAAMSPYNVNITNLTEYAMDIAHPNPLIGDGSDNLPNAIDTATGGGGAVTAADFTTLGTAGANAGQPCGELPLPYYTASTFNVLYGKIDTMSPSANHVELRPDVNISTITAEGLIGHFTE